MKIKLKARLSAYSKVRSIESMMPSPTLEDAGKLLGVSESGEYVLISDVANNKISELFEDVTTSSHKNSLIDDLFKED